MKDFEQAAEQYAPMISALMRKLHIYRDFDVFRQAAIVALWQACRRFDESKGDFTPFAYRSMQGAMLDELKKESRYITNVLVGGDELFDELIDERTDEDLPDWLEAAELNSDERALLEALFIKGEKLADLAAREGLSLAGMKKRRERTLKKVRNQLLKIGN